MFISSSLPSVALGLLITLKICCHGRVIHLQPTNECPGSETSAPSAIARGNSSLQNCMLMEEALLVLESDDELSLAPGTYTIRNFSTNALRNVSNVTIVGDVSNPKNVIINCFEGVGLFFFNVSDLTIAGITVERCGISGVRRIRGILRMTRELIRVLYTPLPDFSTAIYLAHCPNVQLSNLIIRDNRGFGLVGVNLIGNVSFHRVHVIQNYPSSCVIDLENYSKVGGSGGGVFLLYQNYVNTKSVRGSNKEEAVTSHDTQFYFTDSNITDNFVCRLNLFNILHDKLPRSIKSPVPLNFSMIGAGGVTFSLAQSKYPVDAHFEDCIFRNNSGTYNGAAMHISQFELSDDSHVFIERTTFEDNGGELVWKYGEKGLGTAGALLVWYYTTDPQNQKNKNLALRLLDQQPSSVVVSNSRFRHNVARSGGAVCALSFDAEISLIQDLLVFNNTEFANNTADFGSAIYLSALSNSAFTPGLKVQLHSVEITRNIRRDNSGGSSLLSESGVVAVNFLNITISGENYIAHNEDTAIALQGAIATLSGSSLFEFNVGSIGGAMSLISESYLVLTRHTNVTFRQNKAFVAGGAIYVSFDSTHYIDYDCFMFLNDSDFFCDLFERCANVTVFASFVDNVAPLGSAIYGSTFTNCPWASGSFGRNAGAIAQGNSTISILNSLTSLAILPKLVVNGSQNIINTPAYSIHQRESNPTFNIMPGTVIETDLGAFDQLNQPVPLTIFSKLTLMRGMDVEGSKATIGATNRYLLNSVTNFTTVPIQVFGMEDSLYRVSIKSDEAQVEFSFLVGLTNCTLGYFYNHSSHSCICQADKFITDITCVDDGSLIVPQGMWVGLIGGYEYARGSCIFDYCSNATRIFLDNETSQCRNSRSGILCGQCREGYSRVFGSTSCMQCSNDYISLIIAFAILGIFLVVAISLLNITITDGYINGLIFYSNILSLYLNVSIPVPASLLGTGSSLLISFINLNLGIETCFYDGMTDIQLAALNLVFPLYLGAILLVITLISKYFHSKHYAKLLSKVNITHVFATLLLLTYSSILRTCIDILSFVDIDIVGGRLRKWRIDPNQDYFHGLHIFEFFAALFFLVVLFPFPLLILFPRVALRLPYVRRSKPLIDAFIAPLADGRAFWVGFRILCRNFFFLLVLLEEEPRNVSLCVFIILITLLQAYIKPFKSTLRNLIDLLIMADLTIVSLLGVVIQIDVISTTTVSKFAFVLVTLFDVGACVIFVYYLVTAFPCADKTKQKKVRNFLRSKSKIYFGRRGSTEATMQKPKINVAESELTHTSVAVPSPGRRRREFKNVGYRESMFNDYVEEEHDGSTS